MSVFLPVTFTYNHRHESGPHDIIVQKIHEYGFNKYVYLLSIREITAETGNHGWVSILPVLPVLPLPPFFFFFIM